MTEFGAWNAGNLKMPPSESPGITSPSEWSLWWLGHEALLVPEKFHQLHLLLVGMNVPNIGNELVNKMIRIVEDSIGRMIWMGHCSSGGPLLLLHFLSGTV